MTTEPNTEHSLITDLTPTQKKQVIPIIVLSANQYTDWYNEQSDKIKTWLNATNFKAECGSFRLLPKDDGTIAGVVFCTGDSTSFWCVGDLSVQLPAGIYTFDETHTQYHAFALAWALGAYQITSYKQPKIKPAQLYLSNRVSDSDKYSISNTVAALNMVRDWINTPTDDMGPSQFAAVAQAMAEQYQAKFNQIVGDDLLQEGYHSIHTVGRASDDPPRLLDIRWGDPKHPRVTLVGKGVCFDSGGLDIKSAPYMLLMKKDMAGGAHVLGLARMIMAAKLPICLRVLIPVVENAISGNAYRPGDIIKSRKGITIEIGNTDAEGRVILADALTEAVSEQPDLLIDITTLTGAARIALGTELPALFANSDEVANDVITLGNQLEDPVWRLPLYEPYRQGLNSIIADINNCSTDAYGGAISAALFLKEFIPNHIPWIHLDMMAWNLRPRPGRPLGAEACALRALFAYLKQHYQSK